MIAAGRTGEGRSADSRRSRHDPRYTAVRRLCALVGVPYFRPRVEFAEPLPRGPFIVACNHATLLDWAALAYFIPQPVRFLITRDYYDAWYFRWFCRLGGAIPVHASRVEPSAVKQALLALARGEVVGVFPEGRITRDGRPLPFQRGVIELARRAGCPIVPATIRGAYDAFPRHRHIPRPVRVVVAFGSALSCTDSDSTSSPTERRRRCTEIVRELERRVSTLQ